MHAVGGRASGSGCTFDTRLVVSFLGNGSRLWYLVGERVATVRPQVVVVVVHYGEADPCHRDTAAADRRRHLLAQPNRLDEQSHLTVIPGAGGGRGAASTEVQKTGVAFV